MLFGFKGMFFKAFICLSLDLHYPYSISPHDKSVVNCLIKRRY